jgi:serine/threonine protein kinase
MEPKRLIDSKYTYTKSSDIYSFGVLMWEISSGYPPFKDHDDERSLICHISNGNRETTISDTPIEYENLYKVCWNQEPEQRPVISEILDKFKMMGFKNTGNKSINGMYLNIFCVLLFIYYNIYINKRILYL